MNRSLSAAALFACPILLYGCGAEAPIAQTAEAAPPVVETQPGVSQIYGRWAANAGSCASGAITIGDGKLETPERTCIVTPPERNGEGWLATLECSGRNGGENTGERVRFVPSGDRLELNFVDRAERNDEHLARCPG